MAITYHKGMLVAQAVVALVLTMEEHYVNEIKGESKYGIDADIIAFTNCREQGLTLRVENAPIKMSTPMASGVLFDYNTPTCYFITQHRSSDSIVIYVGTADVSGLPNEDAWENAQFFKYNEPYQAADWIMKDIVERINKALAPVEEVVESTPEPKMTAEQLAELIGKIRKATNVQEVNLIIKDLPDNIKKALNNVKRF